MLPADPQQRHGGTRPVLRPESRALSERERGAGGVFQVVMRDAQAVGGGRDERGVGVGARTRTRGALRRGQGRVERRPRLGELSFVQVGFALLAEQRRDARVVSSFRGVRAC